MATTMTIRATHDTAERIRELTEKLCEKTSSKVNTAETLTLMVDFLAGNNRKSKDYTDQMVEIMLINRVIQADRSVFCHGSAQIAENSEGGGDPYRGGEEITCSRCNEPVTLNRGGIIPVHSRPRDDDRTA